MLSRNLMVLATILTCFASCSSKDNQATNNSVLEINPEIMEISSFLDHVEKVRIIPLETRPDVIIGSILTIEAFADRFFAFDMQFKKSVFIYDSHGAWINTICSVGKGPAEYTNPKQFAVDPFNKELVIVDPSTKKILRYDLDGNFISEVKLEFLGYSIGFVDSETYAFKSMDDNRNPVVVTTDRKGGNKTIVHTGIFEFNRFLFTHFPNYKGKQFYIESINDTVYHISKDKAEPWHYIDFLELKVTKSDQKELINWSRANKWIPRISKSQAGDVYKYLETDKMILVGCRYKGKTSNIWVNKSNNSQYTVQRIGGGIGEETDPFTDLFIYTSTTDDTGKFISHIRTDTYLGLFENDKFNEYLDKGIIEIEDGGFANQGDVTLESNPVLAIIEMK